MPCRLTTLAGILLAAVPPVQAQVGRACAGGPSTFVTDSGVGGLRLGLSRADATRFCRVISDTMVPNDDYMEMEHVLVIDLGSDTVIAALGPDATISRIDILRPTFRTRDGLRVGMTLRQLLSRRGLAAGIGEATVQANVPEHCGLSLVLSEKGAGEQGDDLTSEQLAQWKPDIRVTKILIRGCTSRNGG